MRISVQHNKKEKAHKCRFPSSIYWQKKETMKRKPVEPVEAINFNESHSFLVEPISLWWSHSI